METMSSEKYLGDIISSDGKNTLNIQERKRRGMVAVSQIMEMMNDLCLGQYYFDAGNLLRNSLLLSTMVSNSEAWYDLTSKEITDLESVDELLLRKLLSAHSKTPKETLYLETGNTPIRFILMARRLNFLHYILNEDENSLVRRFLQAQMEGSGRGDWINKVKSDLEELEMIMTLEDIKMLSKTGWKELVSRKVQNRAFNYLTDLKATHSKARNIQYQKLKLQSYLGSSVNNLTIQQKQFIFAARTRMLDVKVNFKTSEFDLSCRKCRNATESQEHLLSCEALLDGNIVLNSPHYEDILGVDREKIIVMGRILIEKYNLLKTPSAPTSAAAAVC